MANQYPQNAAERLLWFDAEFTDLDLQGGYMVEVAGLVTDLPAQEVVTEYHAFVAHDLGLLATRFDQNDWWLDHQDNQTRIMAGVEGEGKTLEVIDRELTDLANMHFDAPPLLAGSSVHYDRRWIDRDLPNFSNTLHYRMVDVSTLKELVAGLKGVWFPKAYRHEAVSDIRESIAEMHFLLDVLSR